MQLNEQQMKKERTQAWELLGAGEACSAADCDQLQTFNGSGFPAKLDLNSWEWAKFANILSYISDLLHA